MEPGETLYNFRFSPEAQEELAEIVEYYSTRTNPDNGKRFLVKVEDALIEKLEGRKARLG
jgi:plasmid stabilization system protein ParE